MASLLQQNRLRDPIRFGTIGHGRFGQLWAAALAPFGEVTVFDKSPNVPISSPLVRAQNLREAAQADIVFLLVPISVFKSCCLEIQGLVRPGALVVDVCSVKQYPVHIMESVFDKEQPLFATHPLFGPDSALKTGGLKGHKIVVCPLRQQTEQENYLMEIFKALGLQILLTTPADHDQQMAASQGLVHFLGRGLQALNMHEQAIATPDFQALLHINHMVINDSWQLFLDMHRYNPYTQSIRKKLIDELTDLNENIEQKGQDI